MKSDGLPCHFEPLEMDCNGIRSHEARLNDFDKHTEVCERFSRALWEIRNRGIVPCDYQECIIEVGSWAGANAIMMAKSLRVPIYCVDTWKGGSDANGITASVLGPRQIFQTFCRNCREYLWDRIIPCVGHSRTYAEVWPFQVPGIFIDADHTYESCREDLELWWPHVAPGGILLGHDYESFEGVKRAADEFGIDGHKGDLFWKVKHVD